MEKLLITAVLIISQPAFADVQLNLDETYHGEFTSKPACDFSESFLLPDLAGVDETKVTLEVFSQGKDRNFNDKGESRHYHI